MFSKYLVRAAGVAAIVFAAGAGASAATYTDATGEEAGTPAQPAVDIASVSVSNDSSNLSFVINLASGANLTSYPYVYYEIGIQTSAGGSDAISNPYGNPIGISTGMTDFIAAQLGPNQGYVYEYQPSAGAFPSSPALSSMTTPVSVTNTTGSVTVTVPLSFLGTDDANFNSSGLGAGNSFNFDVWTTYGGASNSAYDALDNPTTTPGYGGTYDAATASGSTFAATTYTITGASTPEPTSLALLGITAGGLMRRARRQTA